jgi:hypothetical protein
MKRTRYKRFKTKCSKQLNRVSISRYSLKQ